MTDRLRHRQTDTDTGSQLVPALAERRASNDKKNKGKHLLRGKCKNTNSAQLIHHVSLSSTLRMALISCDISATSSTMQFYSFSLLPVTDLVNKNYHVSACSATAAAAAAPSRRCLHQTSSDDARYYGSHDDHVTEWWRHRRLVAQRRFADANFGRDIVITARLAADETIRSRFPTKLRRYCWICKENVGYARCPRRIYTVSQKTSNFYLLNNSVKN